MGKTRAQAACDFFDGQRPWTWIKHTIIADYLVPWSRKLGSRGGPIYVVDAFAGAGAYTHRLTGERSPGSPIICAEAARCYSATGHGRQMRVLCTEKHPANFRRLERELRPYADVAEARQGGFVGHLDWILEETAGKPMLLLLDPIGVKELDADACRRILTRPGKTDAFVIVDFDVVHRIGGQLREDGCANDAIRSARNAAAMVDGFFCTREWRDIFLDRALTPEARERAWLDLWFAQAIGGTFDHPCAYAVRERLGGPAKYWIVLLSRHRDAFWLMNDEVVKVDEMLGQQQSVPSSDAGRQLGLFDDSPEPTTSGNPHDDELAQAILAAVADSLGGITFERVKTALVPEFFGRVKEGDYGRAVKQLLRCGTLQREDRAAARLRPDELLRAHAVPAFSSRT